MSEWPKCTCGCGKPTAKNRQTGQPCTYATKQCNQRAWKRRMKLDADRWHRHQAKQKGYARQHAERNRADPERTARARRLSRERNRRRYWRKRNDVHAWKLHLEEQRLRRAMNRERSGLPARRRLIEPPNALVDDFDRLPAAPLAAWIDKRIIRGDTPDGLGHLTAHQTVGSVCAWLGIAEKNLYEWRRGLRSEVQFDVVDRILTNADVLWWDIYDPDRWPEEYEQVRAVFEPDEDVAA